jgi:hypothetical protein
MDTLLSGTCVKIIELTATCVTRLRVAEKRYQKADLTITLLMSHLSTLKAALTQIQTWVGSDSFLSSQHYQLIMDVDAALAGCYLLLGVLDEHISKLNWDSEDELDFTSKARVVLNHRVTKECIGHLSHQSIALNLLLTAFQWYVQTISEKDNARILTPKIANPKPNSLTCCRTNKPAMYLTKLEMTPHLSLFSETKRQ